MIEFILVGVGGFFGSGFRYLVGKGLSGAILGFPLGTLVVNLVASILMGIFYGFSLKTIISQKIGLFLMTGLLGGFSTFSAFSIETVNLFTEKKYAFAITNILLNVVFCLVGAFVGLYLTKGVKI